MEIVLAAIVAIVVLGFVGWLLYPSTKLRRDARSAEKMRIGFVMGLINETNPELAGQKAGAAMTLIERFEKTYGRKPTEADKALLVGMMAGGKIDL
jgi:hypothetical protein